MRACGPAATEPLRVHGRPIDGTRKPWPVAAALLHLLRASPAQADCYHENPSSSPSRHRPHERTMTRCGAPMPFLFQRRRGAGRWVISPQTVPRRLKRLCVELAGQHPAFATTPSRGTTSTGSLPPGWSTAACPPHRRRAVWPSQRPNHHPRLRRRVQQRRRRPLRRVPRPAAPAATRRRIPRRHPGRVDEFDEHFGKRKGRARHCGAPNGTPASTSTPASAAQSCMSTPRCSPASTSWKPTCSPVAGAPRQKAGPARSRAATAPSPSWLQARGHPRSHPTAAAGLSIQQLSRGGQPELPRPGQRRPGEGQHDRPRMARLSVISSGRDRPELGR
jgi:hypothetical protein